VLAPEEAEPPAEVERDPSQVNMQRLEDDISGPIAPKD
jgi:hypothetical protein